MVNAGLHYSLYDVPSVLHSFRRGCKKAASSLVPLAISNSAKGQVIECQSFSHLVVEISLSGRQHNDSLLYAFQRLIRADRDYHF